MTGKTMSIRDLPGPPIVEEAFPVAFTKMLVDGTAYTLDLHRRYGLAFQIWKGPASVLFLAGMEANAFLASRKGREVLKQHTVFKVIPGTLKAHNLLPVTEGENHKRMRKVLNAGMNRHSLEKTFNAIVEQTDRQLETLLGGGEKISVEKLAALTTTNQVAAALETELTTTLTEDLLRVNNVLIGSGGAVPNAFAFSPRFIRSRDRLREFGESQVQRLRSGTEDDMPTLLRDLFEANKVDPVLVREEDIPWHFIIPFFGSLETLPPSVVNLVHYIMQDDEVLRRVREEATVAFADHEVRGVELLKRMPFLTRVIQESLRIRPAAWAVRRTAVEDFEFAGYRIPRGQSIVVSTTTQHFMQEYFADPLTFDPDRSELPDKSGIWAPFGKGTHMCPGISLTETLMTVFAARLFLQWEVSRSQQAMTRPMEKVFKDWGERHFDVSATRRRSRTTDGARA